MIKRVLISLLVIFCANACAQTKKENKKEHLKNYAPMDFIEHNGDLSFSGRSGDGTIDFRCYHGYSFETSCFLFEQNHCYLRILFWVMGSEFPSLR